MKQRLAVCAALLIFGLADAKAQPIYVEPGLSGPALPPYEIMTIVRSTGLTPLSRPVRRGPSYVLAAANRRGGQMRVVIDAYLGDIVSVRPLDGRRIDGVRLASRYDPQRRLIPPRPIPNTRPAIQAAPAMLKPAPPPVPRPRPQVASTEPPAATAAPSTPSATKETGPAKPTAPMVDPAKPSN